MFFSPQIFLYSFIFEEDLELNKVHIYSPLFYSVHFPLWLSSKFFISHVILFISINSNLLVSISLMR